MAPSLCFYSHLHSTGRVSCSTSSSICRRSPLGGRTGLQPWVSNCKAGRMASCRRHVCFSAQTEAATEVDTDALATAEESAPVAAEADAPQNAAADAPAQPPQLSVKWQHILDTQAKGTVCSGKIRGFNKAGVILEVSALKQRGFVPWGKLDLTRLPGPDPNDEDRKKLYGQEVLAKVVQVNIPKRQIIMSEQAVVMHELATSLKGGDVVSGVVKNTTNFGAFISLASPDGKLHGAVGMVHLTELSWNRVGHPDDIVQPGQQVQCRVLKVDAEKDHIYLSMKQLETDPLLENLDGLLPLTLDMPSVGSVPTSLPSAVEDLCAALMREPGIDDVSVGRQVEEKRAVSQDLELWISKEVVEDGYNLVVRTGRLVQEIHVRTQLPGEGMKECVQRVLRQLV